MWGDKYTWERSIGTGKWIQERLDRGLATQEWCNLFPMAAFQVLDVATSDHLPLYLHLQTKVYIPRSRRFKFENVWLKESDCVNVVTDRWRHTKGREIDEKINYCCLNLDEWGGGFSKEYKRKLMEYKARMRKLRGRRDRGHLNV